MCGRTYFTRIMCRISPFNILITNLAQASRKIHNLIKKCKYIIYFYKS